MYVGVFVCLCDGVVEDVFVCLIRCVFVCAGCLWCCQCVCLLVRACAWPLVWVMCCLCACVFVRVFLWLVGRSSGSLGWLVVGVLKCLCACLCVCLCVFVCVFLCSCA